MKHTQIRRRCGHLEPHRIADTDRDRTTKLATLRQQSCSACYHATSSAAMTNAIRINRQNRINSHYD